MQYKLLEHLGLTHNESIIYLALLNLGTVPAGKILKEAQLNTGKIYNILESLQNKGLVSESTINNIRHFTAAPPKQLLVYLKQKKAELQHDEKQIRKIIPELEQRRTVHSHEPRSMTYTGFEGFKIAVKEATEAMKPNEEFLSYKVTTYREKKYADFWKKWMQQQKSRRMRIIFMGKGREYEEIIKNKNVSARVLPGTSLASMDIFGENTVLLVSYAEPVTSIVIHSPNFVNIFKNSFEERWKVANE